MIYTNNNISDDKYSTGQPCTLAVSFRPPAGVFISDVAIGNQWGSTTDFLTVDGRRWYFEESPLIEQGDILCDRRDNLFVGMTFPIRSPEWQLPLVRQMLEGLDANVIRVTDYSDPVVRAAYANANSSFPYLEILWSPSSNYSFELGQLSFGSWAFGYSVPRPSLFNDSPPWTVPYGFIVVKLQKYLNDFKLEMPNESLYKQLDVQID